MCMNILLNLPHSYLPGNPARGDHERWEIVLNHWASYRDLIGLEGELYLGLLAEGQPEHTIEHRILAHRTAREEALPTFYDLIGRRK